MFTCVKILMFIIDIDDSWEYNVEYLSLIDPERGGFGEVFPEVRIFPEGFSSREILLKEIFRRIPRAEGL